MPSPPSSRCRGGPSHREASDAELLQDGRRPCPRPAAPRMPAGLGAGPAARPRQAVNPGSVADAARSGNPASSRGALTPALAATASSRKEIDMPWMFHWGRPVCSGPRAHPPTILPCPAAPEARPPPTLCRRWSPPSTRGNFPSQASRHHFRQRLVGAANCEAVFRGTGVGGSAVDGMLHCRSRILHAPVESSYVARGPITGISGPYRCLGAVDRN